MIAPAKTPYAVIEKLNVALTQALAMPQVRDTLAKQQAQPQPGLPDDFAALIGRELARMKRAVTAAKIEIQ